MERSPYVRPATAIGLAVRDRVRGARGEGCVSLARMRVSIGAVWGRVGAEGQAIRQRPKKSYETCVLKKNRMTRTGGEGILNELCKKWHGMVHSRGEVEYIYKNALTTSSSDALCMTVWVGI